MIAHYTMKINGVWYKSGDDIPDTIPPKTITENESKKQHTKTDINKMSVSELRKLGLENGIDNADKLTGTELKKLLQAEFDD